MSDSRNYAAISNAFPTEFTMTSILGSGSEASVEEWKHSSTGLIIAVKRFKEERPFPTNDIKVLTKLDEHPSIIKWYAIHEDIKVLVLERCEGMDLWELWQQKSDTNNHAVLSEAFLWSVYRQISSALAFLQTGIGGRGDTNNWKTVVHRDIKFENIFVKASGVKEDNSDLVIKLGDFGLSAFFDPEHPMMIPSRGAPDYWPPESTFEEPMGTPEGDVWAIGAVIHKLANGFEPAEEAMNYREKYLEENPNPRDTSEMTDLEYFYWQSKAPRKVRSINIPGNEQDRAPGMRARWTPIYSDGLDRCMKLALTWDPEKRATAVELMEEIEEEEAAFLHNELEDEHSSLLEEEGMEEDDG
ncbi:kinase-like protein [Polyplosphaeria fusca]|uniref:Kinase-like protein n=1 Tax=Polyplosphaeria fusca TaxID=682080 RepID=A0A9P4QHQ1_9PLEO|nr:kinase-like protein [Polyplosphaeria fusca]